MKNILEFFPTGLSASDVADIETISLVMCGKHLTIRQMQVTKRQLDYFVDKFGDPTTTLRGFVFPAYRWIGKQAQGKGELVVIDQGKLRIFHFSQHS